MDQVLSTCRTELSLVSLEITQFSASWTFFLPTARVIMRWPLSHFLCFWLVARCLCCFVLREHYGGWGWVFFSWMLCLCMGGGIPWEINLSYSSCLALYISTQSLVHYEMTHGINSKLDMLKENNTSLLIQSD